MSTAFDPQTYRPGADETGHSDQGRGSLPPDGAPPPVKRNYWRWVKRGLLAAVLLFVALVAYLTLTAPLSRSLEPPAPPSITLLSSEGTPIARGGATIGEPVDAAKLPAHVTNAFLAIEDRRFRSHFGMDPRGIARAAWNNFWAGGVREGGSTITQQLAKNAFLDSDRTMGRKLREVLIAFWLEAWLSKDEILSRYLSNVYFGDNVYGLNAAAEHYFGRTAARLSVGQAAMLAGLVKAPSRLAPTSNLEGARARQKLVVAAMVDAEMLTAQEAADVRPARIIAQKEDPLDNGTYFTDWVMPAARDRAGEIGTELTVRTTLETPIQKAAEAAVRGAGIGPAQIAIVAMRPDGRVVAMVGGRDYAKSTFNRATQAKRQPGSTFKLFVYLAALRAGMKPEDMIEDTPVTVGEWEPKNNDGRYLGRITLRRAFQRSSNVAAARLIHRVGPKAVIQAARDLGITAPIPEEATIALGTSTVNLLELTAAYAAIAAGETPVRAVGLAEPEQRGWLDTLRNRPRPIDGEVLEEMRGLLKAAVSGGTAMDARLPVDAFGKTGTTQNARDVLFIGYAKDLVAGIWIGNDDNSALPGMTSHVPARIWRDFMTRALGMPIPEPVVEEADNAANVMEDLANGMDVQIDLQNGTVGAELRARGFNLRVGPDGVAVTAPEGQPADTRDRRREDPPAEDDAEQ